MRWIFCLALVLPAAWGQAFGPQQVVTPFVDGPLGMHLADLDGDGDLDLLTASYRDDRIAWFENAGAGAFVGPRTVDACARSAWTVTAADLDGDGDLDIVSGASLDDRIAWYANLGSGTFGPRQVVSTTVDAIRSVAAADLDGDGDQDLLASAVGDGEFSWFQNLGGGTFGPEVVVGTGAGARSLDAADLDGDGDLDLLAASSEDDTIVWIENLGAATFAAPVVLSSSIDEVYDAIAIDVDGDGDHDVAACSAERDGVVWFENMGGTFGPVQTIGPLDAAASLCAADVEGDGDLDLFATGFDTDVPVFLGRLVWFRNLGGSFATEGLIDGSIDECRTAVVGDVDGDGDPDPVALGVRSNRISWYPGQPSGGFLGARIVNPPARFASAIHPADVDGDGAPDLLWASSGAARIAWSRNEGANGFGTRAPLSMAADNVSEIDHGDIDGDGDLDVLSHSGADLLRFENLGGGIFGAGQIVPAGSLQVTSINLADLDGDGDLDLVTTGAFPLPLIGPPDEARWQPNDGTGTFGTPQFLGPSIDDPRDAEVADLDGDGDPDIVVCFVLTGQVVWYANLGAGTSFAVTTLVAPGALRPVDVAIEDLDRDGLHDVLVAYSGLFGGTVWFRNLGGGAFAPEVTVALSPDLVGVTTADVDQDGDADVISYSATRVRLSENLGGAVFSFPVVLQDGLGSVNAVGVADFDGDGDPDLCWSSRDDHRIAWSENLMGALTPTLLASQPGGPGTAMFLSNGNLVPGGEYQNLLSLDACPGGPGTGPLSLGGCIVTASNALFLTQQLLAPIGATPFHFLASGPAEQWGPYMVPPLSLDAVCFRVVNGIVGPTSPVIRIDVQ